MSIVERLRRGISTGSALETQSLAAELARALPADATLALHGDLGVGKTTFVQGLARGFGITAPVTSPTYTFCNLYRGGSGMLLAHLDAYRIDSPGQMESLLLDDFLTTPHCLAIEWPEKIAAWLPAAPWRLDFSIAAGERHAIRLR